MIILLTVQECYYAICAGDTFNLVVKNSIVISETFSKKRVITYAATFVYAQEDGTIISPNSCGIFGNKDDLPEEIKNAVYWKDLPVSKRHNFINTAGTRVSLS